MHGQASIGSVVRKMIEGGWGRRSSGTSVGREMRRSCGNEAGTDETQAVPLPGVEGGSSGSALCQPSNCPTALVVTLVMAWKDTMAGDCG